MTYTPEERNLIALASLSELSYKARFEILDGLKSSTPDFEKCRRLIKNSDDGVYNKLKEKYENTESRAKFIEKLEKNGIVCVTYFSDGYPEALRHLPSPPIALFCKGKRELLNTRCFGIVGSRRTLPNVLAECKKFSGEISKELTIVSGIADGADAAAVEGAIENGKAISVLAYGFDFAYPTINKKLMERVAQEGLLLTEFPPQVKPAAYNFPFRNRIIAGLSEGLLVVSAGEKSGTAITARYTHDYGKTVYAFPYGIGVTSGVGCNKLIKDGAKLADSVADILGDFGIKVEEAESVPLTADEEELLKFIKELGDAFVDDIAQKAGKMPFQLLPALSGLEIKQLIKRIGGNRYSAI